MQDPVGLCFAYATLIRPPPPSITAGPADHGNPPGRKGIAFNLQWRAAIRAVRRLPSTERLGLTRWHHPKPGWSTKALFGEATGNVPVGSAHGYRDANRSRSCDV